MPHVIEILSDDEEPADPDVIEISSDEDEVDTQCVVGDKGLCHKLKPAPVSKVSSLWRRR